MVMWLDWYVSDFRDKLLSKRLAKSIHSDFEPVWLRLWA
jgi:hypothetical protein